MNNLSTIGKVLALLIVIVCGIVNLFKGQTSSLENGFEPVDSEFKLSVGELTRLGGGKK